MSWKSAGKKSLGWHSTVPLPSALFLTDRARCPDPLGVASRLPVGTGVILRDYDFPEREQLAERLGKVCSQRDLVYLVAGDPQLAAKYGAHGLHLPERQIGSYRACDRGPGMLLTVSTHSAKAVARAAAIDADAVLLSPIFKTASHPDAEPLGVERFSEIMGKANLPVYALGGLNKENLATIPQSKRLAGYAGIGIFMSGGKIRS